MFNRYSKSIISGIVGRKGTIPSSCRVCVRSFANTDDKTTTALPSSAPSKPINSSINEQQPSESADLWAWVPPRDKVLQHEMKQTYQLPVVQGQLPSTEEVAEYLRSNGANDVVVVPLKEPLVNIKHMVIGSATSTRLIRQLAETICENLKHRELYNVMGSEGVEGGRNDDWQLVDCEHFLVHLMLPDTRKAIDLESHWSMEERPYIPYCRTEREYDEHFERLLQKFPIPKGFNVTIGEEDEPEESHRPIKVL